METMLIILMLMAVAMVVASLFGRRRCIVCGKKEPWWPRDGWHRCKQCGTMWFVGKGKGDEQ